MYKLFLKSIKNYKLFTNLDLSYKKIIFYSEGKIYDHFFYPFVKSCIKNNIKFCYLSSDYEEPFNIKNDNYKFFFIGKSYLRTYLFYTLKCENLITTTPDIGNYYLKRSENLKNLIYFHHSMCGLIAQQNFNALSHYDTILCSHKKHYEELLDYKFKNPKVKLIKFGYPKIDEISDNIKKNFQERKKVEKILIAPSWGNEKKDYQIFKEIINILLKSGKIIKFRPHPMTAFYNKKLINNLKEYFIDSNNFKISETSNNVLDYLESDFIISDWSGSAMEFSLATNKPCLFLNTQRKLFNKSSSEKVKANAFENFFRKYLDCEISVEEIDNIDNKINNIYFKNTYYSKLELLKKDYLYNLGKTDNEIDKFLLSIS